MNMYRAFNLQTVLVVVGVMLLSGCATDPVTEPLHFSPGYVVYSDKTEDSVETANKKCSIHIRTIDDLRTSKVSFGSSPRYRLFAESVPEWFQEGLISLNSQGFKLFVDPGETESSLADITMHIKIHKAYVLHQVSSISANLAVKVDMNHKNNTSYSKLYRGQETSINWVNGGGEVESAMNAAFGEVLESLGKDLERLCVGT